VSRQRLGAATGLNTVFRNLGSAIAPTVAGTILTNYSTYVYFNAPHCPVYFSAPSRDAYVNIDIAMFISALMLILISYAECRRDITHNK
jgi:sugar phosphate permease